jgi:7tm Odorant receptor
MAASYSLWQLSFSVAGMDGLMMACCFYISGQFNIIERQICDLDSITEEDQVISSKLIEIIERHSQTLDLCDRTVEIFSEVILTQFISSSMVVAMISFNLIYAVGVERVKYLFYFAVTVAQMYFFCNNGSMLAESVGDC